MSSGASTIQFYQPHDVTAWTRDIEMQMLQEEILKLKKNLTEANAKQIEENEKAIFEKKIALEKHCRQFDMTYGKYGTGESEVKIEGAKDEETGTMTDGHVKMDGDNTIMSDDLVDATASVAPYEIESAQSSTVNGLDSNGVIESMEDLEETSKTASNAAPTETDIDDPFITPASDIVPTNLFHAPTGTFNDDPFTTYNGGYAPALTNNDSFLDQNMGHVGSTAHSTTNIDIDKFLDGQESEMANYTTSASHNGDAGMDFGGDIEMDMDTMANRAPMAEFEEPVSPDMDKYDNL
ncbi:hypothetical protein QM012_004401 [Aureobasidium pullulans]|uniref:Uncharacterized protein n=1 Tax=Aureobasidium pullulans TaxID=5580 RepID=A0ABR0TTD1_AURPU